MSTIYILTIFFTILWGITMNAFNRLQAKHVSKVQQQVANHKNLATQAVNTAVGNSLVAKYLKPTMLPNTGWFQDRMPTDEEIQDTYLNTGENLFQVCIKNPHTRHARANSRPFIVREAICQFNMLSEKYEWLVGSDDGYRWEPVEVLAWKPMSTLPF